MPAEPRARRTLRLPLDTDRLRLRELAAEDAEDFAALYADRHNTRYLLTGPGDADGARLHLERALGRQHAPRRDTWELAIELRATGRLVGACDLLLHSREEAEVGYVLSHGHWGQGLGTEAATALVREAFEGLQVERVLATVEIHNSRSIRVLDKAGLRWEGTLRRYARAKRRWWDVHLYAVTREDWLTAQR